MKYALLLMLVSSGLVCQAKEKGRLIFEDDFERSESQEEKDEPGNDWTTSSEKTAKGHKQVDLRDGYMFIYTHEEANHATSVRQEFEFEEGRLALRVRFEDSSDTINLNFADPKEKSVHAGHLFSVEIGTKQVVLKDLKTGVMSKEIREARKAKSLTSEQEKALQKKSKKFKNKMKAGKWHDIEVEVSGDTLSCSVDGKLVGEFSSEGFSHESKRMIRLLVSQQASVDEVRIWKF